MDRVNRWDRVEKAYNALLLGEGNRAASSAEAIKASYDAGVTDEFVVPTVIGGEETRIHDNDAIIFFNFRPDRAREITRAMTFEKFDGFQRKAVRKNLFYVCFTQYDETFPLPVAFKPETLTNILGDVLDKHGIKQFRTAETEKYAHVTFFFNGGEEKEFKGEDRILINSPKVATYDLKPEMSVYEVTSALTDVIEKKKYDVIICNFANGDMVGHTGIMDAALKAVAAVDDCLGKVMKAIKDVDGVLLVTADHGNVEKMVDEITGEPYTAHTVGKVQAVLYNAEPPVKGLEDGRLADISPTLLDLMQIEKPVEMTGHSLIKK